MKNRSHYVHHHHHLYTRSMTRQETCDKLVSIFLNVCVFFFFYARAPRANDLNSFIITHTHILTWFSPPVSISIYIKHSYKPCTKLGSLSVSLVTYYLHTLLIIFITRIQPIVIGDRLECS